jgi:hypothetical protein
MVNYYPESHGWAAMWTAWDPSEFDRDMSKVASLGANAVRLIVQPSAFGYPTPTQLMKSRLASAVTIAGNHGLSVELTLFDWFSSYLDVAGSKVWASSVVGPYSADRRVFAIELQNEIPVENPAAVAWAAAMLPHLRSIGPIPTTVSVNGSPARLAALKTLLGGTRPSFWSYHYYDQIMGAGAGNAFAMAKAAASPEPLYIGETGADTVPRVGEDATAAEARQDHFYRAVFIAAAAQGLPTPSPWTLWDFTPGSVPGRPNPGQYAFGLLRLDGSLKPAAVSTWRAFTGKPTNTAINGTFEGSTSSIPAEWALYLPDQATFAVDRSIAHSGSTSVRFSQSLGDATGWPSAWTAPVQVIDPSHTYAATTWAKGTTLTGTNRLGLTWYDAAGKYLGVTTSASVKLGTTDWQQLSARGVPPANAAVVLVQLQTTRNTGTVWFDDVTFG